jgi:hypothetical protein
MAGIFLTGVFFVIFTPAYAFGFGAFCFALGALGFGTFLDAMGFDGFFCALDLGFGTLAGAGIGALSSAFLVLAARGGCLQRGGGKAEGVIVDWKFWVGKCLR